MRRSGRTQALRCNSVNPRRGSNAPRNAWRMLSQRRRAETPVDPQDRPHCRRRRSGPDRRRPHRRAFGPRGAASVPRPADVPGVLTGAVGCGKRRSWPSLTRPPEAAARWSRLAPPATLGRPPSQDEAGHARPPATEPLPPQPRGRREGGQACIGRIGASSVLGGVAALRDSRALGTKRPPAGPSFPSAHRPRKPPASHPIGALRPPRSVRTGPARAATPRSKVTSPLSFEARRSRSGSWFLSGIPRLCVVSATSWCAHRAFADRRLLGAGKSN